MLVPNPQNRVQGKGNDKFTPETDRCHALAHLFGAPGTLRTDDTYKTPKP